MANFLHGAYGLVQRGAQRGAQSSLNTAFVYIGTAPVHTIPGGAANVNRPVAVWSGGEARALFGYSEDWEKYTLCEAMYAHLDAEGAGPLVLINVFDPATHKAAQKSTVELTPVNGRITVTDAESVWLDSVGIETIAGAGEESEELEKGSDYTLSYDSSRRRIEIREASAGALGSESLRVSYYTVTPSTVTDAEVIGTSDGNGLNTGLCAVRSVYQETGLIPAYLAAPGFSCKSGIHAAMLAAAEKIGGHWDAFCFADLPLTDNGTALTLDGAAAWKTAHGYDSSREKVFFPRAAGVDGRSYHLSVLAAAKFHTLLLDRQGIPARTVSNAPCPVIQSLLIGGTGARVLDEGLITDKLNANGITSAAYVGGRWAIWGSTAADYSEAEEDGSFGADVDVLMLLYLCNDFQHRRAADVDKTLTANDLRSMIAEEQARLDALVKNGALAYGEVNADTTAMADTVVDYRFNFDVRTSALCRSLTAVINWTAAEGFSTWLTAQEG